MPYGGSISQVAAGDQALDAATRAQFERALDRIVQAHADMRKERSDTDREAEQKRQFDASLALRQAEADQARTERGREFDATSQYRKDALREQQRTRRENLLLNSRRNSAMDADRQTKMLLPNAQDAADQGAFGSLEDFTSSQPTALQPYAAALVQRSLRARDALKQLYHADLADADVLSRDAALAHMIDMEKQSSWNPDKAPLDSSKRPFGVFWNRANTPDPNAVQEWTTARGELMPQINAIKTDRNRIGRLVPNDAGGYDAVPPSWMSRLPVRPQAPAPAAPAPAPAATPWQEGAILQHNTTGQKFRVTNGQLVPLAAASANPKVLPVEPDETLDENFAQ